LVVTQGAGDVATYVAASEPEFADAFLADQHVYSASSDNGAGTLVPEGNGYRVEGRWGFCSGCQGATWVGGFARFPAEIVGNQTSEGRWVLVPVARARIDENWDTMGMMGTGSHSVILESQHVVAAWTCLIERSGPMDYGQASIAAGNGYWPRSTAVSATQIGIARRALDSAAELALKKSIARSKELLCQNAHVQRQLMRRGGLVSEQGRSRTSAATNVGGGETGPQTATRDPYGLGNRKRLRKCDRDRSC
jgi:hypothetical protein